MTWETPTTMALRDTAREAWPGIARATSTNSRCKGSRNAELFCAEFAQKEESSQGRFYRCVATRSSAQSKSAPVYTSSLFYLPKQIQPPRRQRAIVASHAVAHRSEEHV